MEIDIKYIIINDFYYTKLLEYKITFNSIGLISETEFQICFSVVSKFCVHSLNSLSFKGKKM